MRAQEIEKSGLAGVMQPEARGIIDKLTSAINDYIADRNHNPSQLVIGVGVEKALCELCRSQDDPQSVVRGNQFRGYPIIVNPYGKDDAIEVC